MQVTELSPATAVLLSEKVARGEFVAIAGDRIPVRPSPGSPWPISSARRRRFRSGLIFLAICCNARCILLFSLRRGRTSEIHFELFRESIRLPRQAARCARLPIWPPSMRSARTLTAGARRCSGLTFTIFGACRRWTQPMLPLTRNRKAAHDSLRHGRLTIEDIVDIAAGIGAREYCPTRRNSARRSPAAPIFWIACCAKTGTIYGVTTGFGDSCTVTRPAGIGRRVAAPSLHLSRLRLGRVFHRSADARRDRDPPGVSVQGILRRQLRACSNRWCFCSSAICCR